jgi:hypothetical protein
MYRKFKPLVKAECIPIEVAIRLERNRLSDIEFDTDVTPCYAHLDHMIEERSRGVKLWVTNF